MAGVGTVLICNWTLGLMKQISPIVLGEKISQEHRRRAISFFTLSTGVRFAYLED
ncbi:hypothetical protein CEDIAZO_01494 [Celerinatantimonas diazotrophica]|nr:hypothetical protein CEDIAZO_01494 [Celerinatantimonas diazotrophica]